MPRKPNYGFDKRRKELERQQKKDAKIQARRERTAAAEHQTPPVPEGAGSPPGSEREEPKA